MANLSYRILILNYDSESRDILFKAFENEDYEFDAFSSAEVGYQKILKQHYDLIVSEVLFKEGQMTGLDLLQKIRGNNISIPFIVISDQNSVESSLKAINFGVSGYLVKPLEIKEAKETIKRAIAHHKSRFVKIKSVNYQMENEFHAQITSSEQSILKILDTVDNLIEFVYPKEYGSFPDLKMAIYEGLSNAKEHGNKNDANKNIFFRLLLKMDKITVHIKDEGEGFNTNQQTNHSMNNKSVNRGLNLIRHLMDEITFNIKGNEINFLKIL
ncbi:MAG: ATP-binding protein [Deltaproteobacteria bacterium]|nr:ATP-binding protein [Deltaproteobacteria bacterium]